VRKRQSDWSKFRTLSALRSQREHGPDFENHQRIQTGFPGLERGNDGDTLPMLALGAHGVISVTSHLAGKQMSDMIYSYVKGDTKKAAEINAQLLPLFTALFLVFQSPAGKIRAE